MKKTKTMRSLIAFLLVFVMLFSLSATVAFAAEDGSSANSGSSSENAGSSSGTQLPDGSLIPDSTPEDAGDLDVGWLETVTDDDSFTATVYPNVNSMLEISKSQLKEIIDALTGALNLLVLDELKTDICYYLYQQHELPDGVEDFGLSDLLEYIVKIEINGHKIYDGAGATFVTEGVKALISELPRPSEIKDFSDSEMRLDWNVVVESDFRTKAFDVSLVAGGGYDAIRKLASLVTEYVDFGYENGTLSLHINVPKKLSDLLLRAASSDKVPESIKQKVFIAMTKDGSDVQALMNSLTFAELIELLEKVDFEAIFDTELLSRFEKLDGLTNEEIVAKAKEYEGYFGKLVSLANRLFDKVPESYMDISVMDLYDGNGLFALDGTKTVNIEHTLAKISSKYGPIIASFFPIEEVTVSVDASIRFEKINSVEFVVGGETYREGLLPEGADLAFFAGIEAYNGSLIIGWQDENGTEYTVMPDADIVLYPMFEFAEATLEGAVSKVYDGLAATLTVSLNVSAENPTVSYKWYKDGVALDDKTGATLDLVNVADSGTYKVEVTVNGKLVTTNEAVVTITPKEIAVTDIIGSITWNYDPASPFVYSGSEYSVYITNTVPSYISVTYSGTAAETNAGSYQTTANFSLNDTNYVLVGGDSAVCDWIIDKKPIDASGVIGGVEWTYDPANPFVFEEGVNRVVGIKHLENLPAYMTYVYGGDYSMTDAGEYTASVSFTATDPNYVLTGVDSYNLTWKILPAQIKISDYVSGQWNYTSPFVFEDGTVRSVALLGAENLPEGVAVTLGGINSATDAGDYTASVNLAAKNTNYVLVGETSYTLNWKILQREIKISDYVSGQWNYTSPFVYEYTTVRSVALLGVQNLPASVTVTLGGINSASDAGDYTATVNLSAQNGNLILVGETSYTLNWKIEAQSFDLGKIVWDKAEFVYDGTEKTVNILTETNEYKLPLDVIVNVSANKQTLPGFYTATATVAPNSNYDFGTTKISDNSWKISFDLSSLTWNYTGAYDFEEGRTYTVSVVLPSGISIDLLYTNNSSATAGKLTATATPDPNSENNKKLSFVGSIPSLEWEIKEPPQKIVIDLSQIVWNYSGNTFKYDGTEKTVAATLPGGYDIAFTYENRSAILPGIYVAKVSLDRANTPNVDSYEFINEDQIPTCEWKISIDLSSLSWDYLAAFTYDGSERTVSLVIPDILIGIITDVSYTGNTASNAGSYVATVSYEIAGNYPVTGSFSDSIEWVINKAEYDMSGVIFADKTVIADGNEHTIELVGTLPSGVSVIYEYKGTDSVSFTAPGVYKIVAKFVGDANHVEIDPMEATLTIEAAAVELERDFNFYDKDGNLILTIAAANGIDKNNVLNFNDVTIAYISPEFGDVFGEGRDGKMIAAYDIHFLLSGIPNPVSDSFTVTLAIPKTYTGNVSDLRVVYIDENGNVENMPAAADGDYITFQTTHFSVYGIVEEIEREVEREPLDLTWLWILILILVIVGIIVLVIILIIKKRGGTDPEEPKASDEPTEPTEPEAEATETAETAEEAPAEEVPAEEAPAEETPVEEAPVVEETAAVEETPAEETPAEEAPVVEETAAVEEAPAEEAPVEETPAEETPAEEAPAVEETAAVEETPAEPEAPAEPVIIFSGDDNEGEATINGQVIHVRYRSSFQSRLIQSEPPIQDYYTVLKNALLSYKGVKARTSWNFESFNKGRIQCAKLNVKGRSFLVYLNLNLDDYNVNKYHFTDASDKPKFADVPMLLKVKSDRSLKYALELIDEVMKNNGIEKAENPEVDYHMPYEPTSELVKRDLVKVILPPGVKLSDFTNVAKADVGAIIDAANAGKKDEAPVEKAPVAEEAPAVEETVAIEEAPAVEEATAVEETAAIEEAPVVEEAPAEIHVDATHADEILTDEEAVSAIEIIERTKKVSGNKLVAVNIDTICANFDHGATVTLDALKAKRLVPQNAARVKILARGVMTKDHLTVIADKFSLQAVKMITLAGGIAEQYK